MNQPIRRSDAVIVLIVAALLLVFAIPAHAATEPAPKPVIAAMNNYQAYAATVSAAHGAKADQCNSKTTALQTVAAKCTSEICLALFADKIERACGEGSGSGQTVVAQAPPQEKSIWAEIKDTVIDFGRVAVPVFDRVMTSRDNRAARESSERQTIALYSTFGGMFTTSTTALKETALGGFAAQERGIAAAFAAQKDTYNIDINNSSEVALFGSTINKTNKCANKTGDGGDGGNSSPGGQGGNNGAGGSSNAAAGAPSGSAPCTITK